MDMTYAHKVANWCFDGTVFFEQPHDIVRRPLAPNAHMVSIESRVINLRVTNTHRMVVKSGQNGKWKKIRAEELNRQILPACGVAKPLDVHVEPECYSYTKHALNSTVYHLMKTGQCTDREEARKEALRRKTERAGMKRKQPCELTLDECRLIGFWIADGTATKLQSCGIEYILAQSKTYPAIIRWVDALLERTGYAYLRKERRARRSNMNDYVHWSLPRGTGHGSQKRNGLYPIEPYLDKHGSALLWGLNERQFDALVEGYWYGDGLHGQAKDGMPTSISARDTKRSWIELLCALGPLRGWRCAMHTRPQKNPKHNTQYEIRMIKHGAYYS